MENEEPKKKQVILLVGSVGGNVCATARLLARLEQEHKGAIIVVGNSNEEKKNIILEQEIVIPIRNLICEIPTNNYDYFAEKKAQDEMLKRQNKLREKHFNKNSSKMFRKKK